MSSSDAVTVPKNKLSARFVAALEYAMEKHADQTRKAKDITYLGHLLGAASHVLEAGGSEEVAIAALLHDVIEDCGGEAVYAEIVEKFGTRIADIAMACSDSFVENPDVKLPWRDRKEHHIAKLRTTFFEDRDVLMVTAADKLHNLTCIVADLDVDGRESLSRFNEPDGILWYYEEMLQLIAESQVSAFLHAQLASKVAEFRVHVGA